MKVLGNINVDLDVVNKEYVDGEIKNIDLSDYAKTKDLDAKADKSHTHNDLVSEAGIDSSGLLTYKQGYSWKRTSNSSYNNAVALKDHTHAISDVFGLEDRLIILQEDVEAVLAEDNSHFIDDVVNDNGQIIVYRKGIGFLSGDRLALANHTHDEYLKKGDPIQLTSAQKAELKGERGAPGTPGKDGQNGMITYIRYANNPSGDNMTTSPKSDTTHIGIYTYEGRNAPTAPSVYAWTRIKGDPGESINTWTGTQAEYDRIRSKSSTTLYIIKD